VSDFASDTLSKLQMERSALEKSKAEYSNESDLADDALRDVEKAVDQMRNDAISGKSKMSRKEIESIALQLMNVASKVSDLKEKIPDLENQMRKVTHKEHESTKREALFINEEPMRLDDCLERCKALTGTLQTLKEGFFKNSYELNRTNVIQRGSSVRILVRVRFLSPLNSNLLVPTRTPVNDIN